MGKGMEWLVSPRFPPCSPSGFGGFLLFPCAAGWFPLVASSDPSLGGFSRVVLAVSFLANRLLEETKDELTGLIKRSALKPEQINKALCQELSKHCDESDDFDDDYMDDEL
ncbi:hypothetical protein IEQ34_016906 [Dendrobium chrysotoxum]|uniref:Uncharacterized protein n=1 Tax=Dendrobium chrysotoxum TaxID=161865 RepID=A0AAV7GHN7_DENCH|nr:hypothetical protein IEQ34_016906 [Dendrobium chrysotoxum]